MSLLNYNIGRPDIPHKVATVSNFAGYFNVFSKDIIDFLDPENKIKLTSGDLLAEFQIRKLYSKFGPHLNIDDIIWEKVKNARQTTTQNTEKRDFNGRQIFLHDDIFIKERIRIEITGFDSFITYFTDEQAINLCSKMSSSYARRLCSDIYRNFPGKDMNLIKYQIHYIANRALKVFGGKVVTFVLGLPKLKFKSPGAEEVRTYLNVNPEFPLIHFKTSPQINIAFFAKQTRPHSFASNILLYKHKSYELIGRLDINGAIWNRLKSFSPQLSLFVENINNKEYKIYSGVETGKCDICGLPLTDPNSLRVGIGPTCAKRLAADFS